jgi:hypothetical protein
VSRQSILLKLQLQIEVAVLLTHTESPWLLILRFVDTAPRQRAIHRSMSAVGQTEKSSVRAYVFRFAPVDFGAEITLPRNGFMARLDA